MCGVTLILFDKNKHLSKDFIEKFTKTLIHRGPDGINYYNNDEINLSVGHSRLKIIDTSDLANQPFTDETGRFILSYNGEIFNYLELRKELKSKGYKFKTESDTEVLLYSYIEWKEKCVYKFNGFWSFIIFDKNNKNFFISRDRFGVKPLYYYFLNNSLVISSELKSFKVLSNQIKIGINLNEIYKLRKETISEETLLKNVKMLLPGHNIKYNLRNFIIEKWWETADHLQNFNKNTDYVEELSYLFRDSCKLRLRSDVPLTTSLSGGLDSSAIVAEINQNYNNLKSHKSFFLNYEYKDNEQKYVEALKSKYNLDLDEIKIEKDYSNFDEMKKSTLYQEKIGDDGIGAWRIYKKMRSENYRVSLDGRGPDELMGGYNEYQIELSRSSFLTKIILSNIKKVIKKIIGMKSEIQSKYLYFNPNIKRNLIDKDYEIPHRFNGLQKVMYHDFHYGSLPLDLEKYDKISMAHSIESREPFLDYRIVCLMFSLPLNYKFNLNETKIILKKMMNEKLPKIILNRKLKKGHGLDYDGFDLSFKKMIDEIIFSNDFKKDELFNFKLIEKHIKNKTINYKLLFRYVQAYLLKNNLC